MAEASAVFAAFSLIQGNEQAQSAKRQANRNRKEALAAAAKQEQELKDQQSLLRSKEVNASFRARGRSNRQSKLKGGTIATGPQGSFGVLGGGKTLLGA